MRNLEELLSVEPKDDGRSGEAIFVSAEELRLLAELEGARISTGFEGCADGESTRGTQRCHLNGKTYFWLEGFFTRTVREPYPIS